MRKHLAFIIVVLAALSVPALALAQNTNTVQGGNSSSGSSSSSGGSTGSNSSTTNSSTSAGGSDSSSASMNGSTDTTINQNTDASSGPAVADSQVHGIVDSPKPGSGSGSAGSGPSATLTPGEDTNGHQTVNGPGGAFNAVQTPKPKATATTTAVRAASSHSTGDKAGTILVALVMLAGIGVGLRKIGGKPKLPVG